jgi:hypothetical protein
MTEPEQKVTWQVVKQFTFANDDQDLGKVFDALTPVLAVAVDLVHSGDTPEKVLNKHCRRYVQEFPSDNKQVAIFEFKNQMIARMDTYYKAGTRQLFSVLLLKRYPKELFVTRATSKQKWKKIPRAVREEFLKTGKAKGLLTKLKQFFARA